MGIFASIMDKIFHHEAAAAPSAAPVPNAAPVPGSIQAPPPADPAPSPPPPVDVEAVLTELASRKGDAGNWRTSIVDLLKLLDLDSSLDARKSLASELNVHTGADGSAEENIALQGAVMQKLAENGGVVPASLKG